MLCRRKLIAKERHFPVDLLFVTQSEPWRRQLKLQPIPHHNERGSAGIVVCSSWEILDSWDGYGDEDDEQQPCAYQEFQQWYQRVPATDLRLAHLPALIKAFSYAFYRDGPEMEHTNKCAPRALTSSLDEIKL